MSFSEIDFSAGEPAPIDLLEQLFDANGWASERVGDEEIVTTVKGGWCTYQLRALWRGEDLGWSKRRVTDSARYCCAMQWSCCSTAVGRTVSDVDNCEERMRHRVYISDWS